ncbi:MAG: precorrin-3B synthase [Pseudomonadota bacterium]
MTAPAIKGPLVKGPQIKGWCPGALRPMLSGDGWVVRIRPMAGRLTQSQAAGIADLSLQYGNGLIDLSSRANVQIRGVTEASHPALIDGLRALGLIDATPQDEAARNIIVTPFWDHGDGTMGLAQALGQAMAAGPVLPGKFGLALDTGPLPVLRGVSADIRIERGADGGLIVRADGMQTGAKAQDPVATVQALAHWFAGHGVTDNRGRMAALIASGAKAPPAFSAVAMLPGEAQTPTPGLVPQGALIALAFGQMTAQTLAALADHGPLRITPWRMVLVEGAVQMPGLPDLITTPDDPLLRVIACTGAPGCAQALGPTRPLARALAPHLTDTLHVSGCAKGCAHPAAAPLTLTATPDGYTLIRNGSAAAQGPTYPAADLMTKLP